MRLEDLNHESAALKDLLRDMPPAIMARCMVKRVGKGVEILRKHEKMEVVYILCEGEYEVLTSFADGQMYVFGKVVSKDDLHLVGEQEVLAEIEVSQATVRTVTDCRFLLLSPKDFWAWIQNDPHAAIILLKELARRLNNATREAGIQLYYPNIYQLKKYLAESYEAADQPLLRVKKKRQQIADELGISLRSVERGVKELKEQGLIRIAKGKIEVDESGYRKILKGLNPL